MKTVTLDILDEHALSLLKDLEKLKIIKLRKPTVRKESAVVDKKVSFQALAIDTKNLKFDREEANE